MNKEQYVHKVFESLHEMPELGFEEFKTSSFIAFELEAMGYQVVTGVGGTGVLGMMTGKEPGQTLAVRADMDALPFEVDGQKVAIHACGHDANSSMALAAARIIAETGIRSGRIIFLFQPAEEKGCGAARMIESGMLPEIDEMVAIHLRDHQEALAGQAVPAVNFSGVTMLDVTIKGRACHGARPHLGINPIDAAAIVVAAVNAVRVDPLVTHTCKVTKFKTPGQAFNIIPDQVNLGFDLRAQTGPVIDQLTEKVLTAIEQAVRSAGAEVEIKMPVRLPTGEYDPDMIKTAKESIAQVLGSSLEPSYSPGSEDFFAFPKRLGIKTTYIGLGGGIVHALHHPDMTFDHEVMESGRDILAAFVYRRLGSLSEGTEGGA